MEPDHLPTSEASHVATQGTLREKATAGTKAATNQTYLSHKPVGL